jgi:hypothetical protein
VHELATLMRSPVFWFGTVVMGFALNIPASYARSAIDKSARVIADSLRIRTTRAVEKRAEQDALLAKCLFELRRRAVASSANACDRNGKPPRRGEAIVGGPLLLAVLPSSASADSSGCRVASASPLTTSSRRRDAGLMAGVFVWSHWQQNSTASVRMTRPQNRSNVNRFS